MNDFVFQTRGYNLLKEASREGNVRALEILAYSYIVSTVYVCMHVCMYLRTASGQLCPKLLPVWTRE